MKTQNQMWTIGIFAVVILAVVGMFTIGGGEAESTTGTIAVDGVVSGAWQNTVVPYKLIVSDVFTGADVASSAKVYDAIPEDWGNPRGDFSEAKDYTIYTASSGIVTINKEFPGTYYVVMTATGYNAEFFTVTIPDGTGRGDLSDYSTSPDSLPAEMSAVGSITEEDFAFTLANSSNVIVKDTILLTVAENTEFRGWKVIITDTEGFSTDTDGDGVYDEGVKSYEVTVGADKYIIFDSAKSIDEFDSNDEFSFLIEGLSVSDESDIVVKVEIKADTGDYVGANDEVWGEGEGVLSYIKIYDIEGSLIATTDVTA